MENDELEELCSEVERVLVRQLSGVRWDLTREKGGWRGPIVFCRGRIRQDMGMTAYLSDADLEWLKGFADVMKCAAYDDYERVTVWFGRRDD